MAQFRNANPDETIIDAGGAFTMKEPPNKREAKADSEDFRDSWLVRALLFLIGTICLSIWAVIGFLVWVPLLTRMITTFSAAVLSAMITGRDPSDAKKFLDYASTFYVRGFVLIQDAMQGRLQHSGPYVMPSHKHFGRMAAEIGFCLLFWVGIIFGWALWAQKVPGFSHLISASQATPGGVVTPTALVHELPTSEQKIKFRTWNATQKKMFVMNHYIRNFGRALAGEIDLQDTGLKDRDGKEIFEGDIVSRPIDRYTEYRYVVVKDFSRFVIKRRIEAATITELGPGTGSTGAASMKVIGNRYENPHLLK